MATWNSRGLRGSTLEDLINRTNEKYMESGLALIQPDILRWHTLNKKVQLIILVQYRGFRYVLMQKNVP